MSYTSVIYIVKTDLKQESIQNEYLFKNIFAQ